MKTLYLLRSANAKSLTYTSADFERNLNFEGFRQAISIGNAIYENKIIIDRIFCSTAKRARQTAILAKTLGELKIPIKFDAKFYGAGRRGFLNRCAELFDSGDDILLIGHRANLELLIKDVIYPETSLEIEPATFIKTCFGTDCWSKVFAGEIKGEIVWTLKPEAGASFVKRQPSCFQASLLVNEFSAESEGIFV